MKMLLAIAASDRSLIRKYAVSRLEDIHIQLEHVSDPVSAARLQGMASELRILIEEIREEIETPPPPSRGPRY